MRISNPKRWLSHEVLNTWNERSSDYKNETRYLSSHCPVHVWWFPNKKSTSYEALSPMTSYSNRFAYMVRSPHPIYSHNTHWVWQSKLLSSEVSEAYSVRSTILSESWCERPTLITILTSGLKWHGSKTWRPECLKRLNLRTTCESCWLMCHHPTNSMLRGHLAPRTYGDGCDSCAKISCTSRRSRPGNSHHSARSTTIHRLRTHEMTL